MPSNYIRRRDLFSDAGFRNPVATVASLVHDARELGLVAAEPRHAPIKLADGLRHAGGKANTLLPAQLVALLDRSVEWIFERNGDVSSFLWLAQSLAQGRDFHLGALIFGLAWRIWKSGRQREAACLIRFLVAVDFDYDELHDGAAERYGFLQQRDPNPLVWKILEHLESREQRTGEKTACHVLELGCGIGNDAMAFISDPRVRTYIGTDLSSTALQEHRARVAHVLRRREELRHEVIEGEVTEALVEVAQGARSAQQPTPLFNIIYAYSSLHRFSSGELAEIFQLAREALDPAEGLFCFALRGEGSVRDSEGIALYRPDVWINHDGQSRWFPSKQAIERLCASQGFDVHLHQRYEHWGSSEPGRKDNFHYVICSPRR